MLGVFQRFESDKQRTGVGRFSPIDVHDEAYSQIPLNLARADTEALFDRIVVNTRRPDGELQIGLDRTSDRDEPVDFVAAFERLRQPVFEKSFYLNEWLVLKTLAEKRGETSEAYLRPITGFINQFQE